MENVMNKATAEAKEKLIDDFNAVVDEAEEVLKSATRDGAARSSALLSRLERNLRLAKERVTDLQGKAVERSKAAAKATDHYVHEHPWQAIGVALGLWIVIGLL